MEVASMKEFDIFSSTDINIEYLSHLNYMDIRQLCCTNKAIAQLCHNDRLFKLIIYRKTGIRVSKKYNVAHILLELDNIMEQTVKDHFPIDDLPVWVNESLFLISQKRKLYNLLDEEISKNIYDIIEDYKDEDEKMEEWDIPINDSSFLAPLVSQRKDDIIDQTNIFLNGKYITVPIHILEYIIEYTDVNKYTYHLIKTLLFLT